MPNSVAQPVPAAFSRGAKRKRTVEAACLGKRHRLMIVQQTQEQKAEKKNRKSPQDKFKSLDPANQHRRATRKKMRALRAGRKKKKTTKKV